MSNSLKSQKNHSKVKVLSAQEQEKIRGGKDLPKWLAKVMNRQDR